MPSKFAASGRPSSPAGVSGSGCGSVVAFWILRRIVSASSVMFIREYSEGSDLLIFAVPSRSDMTRVAGPKISGSGIGNKSTPKSPLNFWAMSRANSRCCFWSSPTGTCVAL